MIEINLLPDVKQELIKAQRQRNTVISIATLGGIIAIGAVIILAVYVFGVQTVRGTLADNSISDKTKKLQNVKDLDKSLTAQSQLESIASVHDQAPLNSRVFDVLTTITPTSGDNAVSINNFSIDAAAKTITIEGQAAQGYSALEAFKKTILATQFEYSLKGERDRKNVPLTDAIVDGDRSYGEDSATNQQVLRFSLSFTYADELLARSSKNGRVIGPERSNVTDSRLEIPTSLFKESPTEGGN